MGTKNELFLDAVNWLIDEGYAQNQGDVAAQAGLGPNLITRIKKGQVKEVSDDSIRALVSRFNMLNIDYFRGKSECISTCSKSTDSQNEVSLPSSQHLDHSSVINAAISAQIETITNLKDCIANMKEQHLRELANMKEQHLRELAEKDAHIADLTSLAEERLHRIAELSRLVEERDSDDMGDYPFTYGVSENRTKKRI